MADNSQFKLKAKISKKRKSTKSTLKEAVKKTVTSKKKPSRKKTPLKRSTLGYEAEFFLLNKKGEVIHEADYLLKKIDEKKRNPSSFIVKEIDHNQIEVGCYPDVESVNTLDALVQNLKLLLFTAEEEGMVICPLGTYPGKFMPQIRKDPTKYNAYQRALGKSRYAQMARTNGFHCHYALPKGVFDAKKLKVKRLVTSKNKDSLVNAYNFLIAADPALITFMQSSPFLQGKLVGKGARTLIMHGDDSLDFPNGIYANHPIFGVLPPYAHTGTDLINLSNRRYEEWKKLLTESGTKESEFNSYYKSILETNWSPLRINQHGTLEQRGMDINHPHIMFAVSVLIQVALRAIQENFYQVEPSDLAVKEPFKIEKKTIYIPPDTYVKNELQKKAVYKGLEDEEVWYYCKRLLWLVKILEGKKIEKLIEPLEKMIKDKMTVSDEIIAEAKKLGYDNYKKEMPAEIGAEIALNHSKRLFKEVVLVEKLFS